MKKWFTSGLFFLSILLFSQGILNVEYKEYTEIELSQETISEKSSHELEIINRQIQRMKTPKYYNLRMTPEESVYKMQSKIDNSQSEDGRTSDFVNSTVYYKNLKENTLIYNQNIGNKDYIVTGILESCDWKITKESKEILGFEVRKATCNDEGRLITVWYASKLAYKNGPMFYQGLPGVILDVKAEITNENGSKTTNYIQAVSINTEKSSSGIEPPKKGKKISAEEYSQLLEERWKRIKEDADQGVDKD